MVLPAIALGGSNASCEVWSSSVAEVHEGRRDALHYRHDGESLFGLVEIQERASAKSGEAPLQIAADEAYRQIFALLDELQYPCIYRFWNYMADINGVSHDLERYRQFNTGRQDAFIASHRQVTGQLPAACALGVAKGPLKVAFLAGRLPATAVENPRQVNAYEYPQQYGPRSPAFSRATLLGAEQGGLLLISGTASVVGHETLHADDAAAQTQETLANLQAVIARANMQSTTSQYRIENAFCRVYLRSAADLPMIHNEMQRTIGPDMQAVFLQADICRADLLLEIEATVMPDTTGSSQ
jgi:chorismate lyase / 3-hydroxybenzoate synthase